MYILPSELPPLSDGAGAGEEELAGGLLPLLLGEGELLHPEDELLCDELLGEESLDDPLLEVLLPPCIIHCTTIGTLRLFPCAWQAGKQVLG
jgi:hypothetical protein